VTDISVAVHDRSLHSVDRRAWDRLVSGGNFYLSHGWLCSVERNRHLQVWYLLARTAEDRLVGALPVYWVPSGGGNRLSDHHALFIAATGAGTSSASAWYPALQLGARTGYSNDLLVDTRLPRQRQAYLAQRLLRAALDLEAGHEVRSIALLYLNQSGVSKVMPNLDKGWERLLTSAEAVMDIRWATFEEYVASLPKSRRSIVRRDTARFARSGCSIWLGKLSDWQERLAPLQLNVQRRHGHEQTLAFLRDYFAWCAAEVDDQSVAFLCKRGERLVGFSLAYRWADTLFMRSVGLEYELVGPQGEYFTLTFYAPIRYAVEQGLSRIHFGMESFVPKCLRGARLMPLWSALRASEPLGREWRRALSEWNQHKLDEWDQQYGRLLGYRPSEHWTT
jgi:predicted N-acyltransferase